MPKFRRSRHLGKRSYEVLTRELENLLNQYTPRTLTERELTQFKMVYYSIINDLLNHISYQHLQRHLTDIEIRFRQIDKDYQLPRFARD